MGNGAKKNLLMAVTAIGAISVIYCPVANANTGSEYSNLIAQKKKAAAPIPKEFSGRSSWYGPGFHGKKTASGELFNMNKPTAAHLRLPFSTKVLVEDPRTGNTVVVRVNDRGPYVKDRVMDMSKEGARKLGTLSRGVFFVDCLVINDEDEEADKK